MPTTSTTRKTPQDRQPKQAARADADTFVMTIDGTDYTSLPLTSVFTPRWARANRRRDELDASYTMIEDAFEGVPGFLDALDGLTFDQQADEIAALQRSMQVTLGELLRSST